MWRRACVFVTVSLVTASAVILSVMVPFGATANAADPSPPAPVDALHAKALSTLDSWAGWLSANNVRGYVGEVGWPHDNPAYTQHPVDPRWSNVADAWYDRAEEHGLPVTAWVTGEWAGRMQLANFVSEGSHAAAQWHTTASSELMERHPGTPGAPHGVNITGPEMGSLSIQATDTEADGAPWRFSNAYPGDVGHYFHYDGLKTMTYLKQHGMEVVRIPFRWERMQPMPYGELDPTQLANLRTMVRAAAAAGLPVILDMHNFAGYYAYDGTKGVRRAIGSAELPISAFTDAWSKIATEFKAEPNIYALDLMNEPVGMPTAAPEKLWEQASQAAVDAIRATGETRLLMIGGYDWSGMKNWATLHPAAWIVDPAATDNIMYEAHQYFDSRNSGVYLSYDEELALTQAQLAPGAPTRVAATAGDAQAVVSWTAPSTTGWGPVTRYTVTSSPGGFTATTTGATSVTLPGLTNGVAYRFTVTASNEVATSTASGQSAAVTPNRHIRSVSAAGKCVQVSGTQVSPDVRADLGNCGTASKQQWTLGEDGTIRGSGFCLGLGWGATAAGSHVRISTCDQTSGYNRWTIRPEGQLVSVSSGRCLTAAPDGVWLIVADCAAGAGMQWVVSSALPARAAVGQAWNVAAPKMCAALYGGGNAPGSPVVYLECNAMTSKQWAPHPDGTWRSLGVCMDVPAGQTANGSLVRVNACTASAQQRWQARSDGQLQHEASGRCLTVNPAAAHMMLADCTATAGQQFSWPALQ